MESRISPEYGKYFDSHPYEDERLINGVELFASIFTVMFLSSTFFAIALYLQFHLISASSCIAPSIEICFRIFFPELITLPKVISGSISKPWHLHVIDDF